MEAPVFQFRLDTLMNTSSGQTCSRYFQASRTRFAATPIHKIESRCEAFRMPNFSTAESNPRWKEDPREGSNVDAFLARITQPELSFVRDICFCELKIFSRICYLHNARLIPRELRGTYLTKQRFYAAILLCHDNRFSILYEQQQWSERSTRWKD